MANSIFQPILSNPGAAPVTKGTQVTDTSTGQGLQDLAHTLDKYTAGQKAANKAKAKQQAALNKASVLQAGVDFLTGLRDTKSQVDQFLQSPDNANDPTAQNAAADTTNSLNKISSALAQGKLSQNGARTLALKEVKTLIDKYPGQAGFIRDVFGIGAGKTNIADNVQIEDKYTSQARQYLQATKQSFTAEDLKKTRNRMILLNETNQSYINADIDQFDNIQTANMSAHLAGTWGQLQDLLVKQGGAISEEQASRYYTAVDATVNGQMQALNQWIQKQVDEGNPIPSDRIDSMRQQIIQQGKTYKDLVTGGGKRGGESRLFRDKLQTFLTAQENFLKSKTDYQNVALLADVVNKLDSGSGAALNDMLSLSDAQMERLKQVFPDQFAGFKGSNATAAGVRARIIQALDQVVTADQVPPGYDQFYQYWIAKKTQIGEQGGQSNVTKNEFDNFTKTLKDANFQGNNFTDTMKQFDRTANVSEGSLSAENKTKMNRLAKDGLSGQLEELAKAADRNNVQLKVTDSGVEVVNRNELLRQDPFSTGPASMGGTELGKSTFLRDVDRINTSLNVMKKHPDIFGSFKNTLDTVQSTITGNNPQVAGNPPDRGTQIRSNGTSSQGQGDTTSQGNTNQQNSATDALKINDQGGNKPAVDPIQKLSELSNDQLQKVKDAQTFDAKVQVLNSYGFTQDEITNMLQRTQPFIDKLQEKVRKAIKAGTMSERH